MKKFTTRQKSDNAPTAEIELDFGAAAARAARVFEPGEYKLRIESARIIHRNQNVHVVLDLIEAESGGCVDIGVLWIEGPNAAAGNLVDKNQALVARLLTLAGLPTAGKVSALIPQLSGLEFDGLLVLNVDKSGRTINALAEIDMDDAS
jgi:hypothetical protein